MKLEQNWQKHVALSCLTRQVGVVRDFCSLKTLAENVAMAEVSSLRKSRCCRKSLHACRAMQVAGRKQMGIDVTGPCRRKEEQLLGPCVGLSHAW